MPVGFTVLTFVLGSSIVSPAANDIDDHLSVFCEAAILPFSLFTLGFSFGLALTAPLSESFRRSAVYQITGLIYFLFVLCSALTPILAGLLVYRFLAGASG